MPDQTTAILRGAADALERRSTACHLDNRHPGLWEFCRDTIACAGDREIVVGLRQLADIRVAHPGADPIHALVAAGVEQQDRAAALRARAEGENL